MQSDSVDIEIFFPSWVSKVTFNNHHDVNLG